MKVTDTKNLSKSRLTNREEVTSYVIYLMSNARRKVSP